jgi:phosphoribosylformylglycinamidine (FGAM) synthase-like amidotransferase family enzyme
MKAKTFLAAGAMLLSLVAIGSAKSWDIVVDANTKAGNVTLPAGSYTVKLNNNQAMFTSETGKTFTVAVKVTNGSAKYSETAVKSEKQGAATVIQSIDLSGTTEELQFGE